jgi:hypothetical protein
MSLAIDMFDLFGIISRANLSILFFFHVELEMNPFMYAMCEHQTRFFSSSSANSGHVVGRIMLGQQRRSVVEYDWSSPRVTA